MFPAAVNVHPCPGSFRQKRRLQNIAPLKECETLELSRTINISLLRSEVSTKHKVRSGTDFPAIKRNIPQPQTHCLCHLMVYECRLFQL